ncbi:MAG: GxxExxY protein [Planctomycetota bacterium]
MNEEVRDPRTYAIIGAAMRVHRELGPGFLEAVYQEALEIELRQQSVPYESQINLPIQYRGHPLKTTYRADLRCYEAVIVELKATSGLTGTDDAQLINYLKCTGHKTGLLINFGTPSLQHRRLVY